MPSNFPTLGKEQLDKIDAMHEALIQIQEHLELAKKTEKPVETPAA